MTRNSGEGDALTGGQFGFGKSDLQEVGILIGIFGEGYQLTPEAAEVLITPLRRTPLVKGVAEQRDNFAAPVGLPDQKGLA